VYTLVLVFAIIVFNFVLFQILPFETSCPGLSYTQCAQALYVPPPPATRSANATAEYNILKAQILNSYGFDQSLPTRFIRYIYNMLTWNFGYNIGKGGLSGPVQLTIMQRLPYTVLLIGLSTVAAYIIGIGLGVVAAAKRGRVVDVSSLAGALFFNALPTFWLGGILIVLQILVIGTAYVNLGTSTIGVTGLGYLAATFSALWLPFLTLTLVSLGGVFLVMRATMIDVLAEDYVVMARAKGIGERTVLFKHALRNAIIPIATIFALSIGFILAGAVITETVFDWPGLGIAAYIGIVANDFPLEQAIFFIISLMVLLANFFVDIAYGYLDPRIKTG
jgi:peptide/nickel transport system permease protein